MADREDNQEAGPKAEWGYCFLKPNELCSSACKAYDEKVSCSCIVLEGLVSLKKLTDVLTQTSNQIVQQIESNWHPK